MISNTQQLEAINSDERTIMCLAGAGAGKSTTMVRRIQRLIQSGVPAYSILALTFTNAAAFEMKEKYKKLEGFDASKGVPEFRTFHSFCYSLIIKDKEVREKLGYAKVPEVCNDNKLKELKTKAKLQSGCKLTEAQLEGPSTLSKKDKFSYDVYIKALKKLIKEENVITFDMLCYNICELFEKDHECIRKYKLKYKHLLVDEFQDTDPRQFRFVSSFPATTSMFFVGDALQSIYQFRGTDNRYVKMLSKAPEWKIIKMYKNYRSTTKICEFANKVSRYADSEYRIEMEGQRDGGSVEVIRGSSVSFNNPVDLEHLRILVDRLKMSKEESAVLCRTNKEVNLICQKLTEEGIEFSRSTKSTDCLDLLNSALDNQYMIEWLSTFLDGKEYGDYIRLVSQQENPDIRWFLTTYGHHAKIKEKGKKIIEIRNIMKEEISGQEKVDKISKLLKLKCSIQLSEDLLLNNKQIVEFMRDTLEEKEDTKIFVGTIHASKGLEYDCVYVVGVNDGMFLLGSEEMNNLYYVAITRAKNKLVVFKR